MAETQKTNGCSEEVGVFHQLTIIKNDSVIQPRISNPYKASAAAQLVPSLEFAETAAGNCRRRVANPFRDDCLSYPEKQGNPQNAEALEDDARYA